MTTNRRRWIGPATVMLLGLASAAAVAVAGDDATIAAAFERLKALEGEWVAASDGEIVHAGQVVSRYGVTAGGSAVVETVFPGGDHEMVTVYYREGDSVVLEHFCVEGNQPRMRARAFDGSRLRFAFDGGGNITDPRRDRHMHSAWIEFLGPNELKSEWTELENGEKVLVVPVHVKRKGA